jgi:L-lactate dehydrogenase complex protein LldG
VVAREPVVSAAREEILRRVRAGLRDVPDAERPADVAVTRAYRRTGEASPDEVLERFEERVRDYHATVRRIAPDGIGAAVTEACRDLGLGRVALPPGVPDAWRPAGVEIVEDRGLEPHALDEINAALTGCAAGIAETGTIVLDGGETSGRRVLTLVPDHHICVVLADQVVDLVAEGFARVAPAVEGQGAPITLVSGPSASSDIELNRVEGVHGPRRLVVLTVAG